MSTSPRLLPSVNKYQYRSNLQDVLRNATATVFLKHYISNLRYRLPTLFMTCDLWPAKTNCRETDARSYLVSGEDKTWTKGPWTPTLNRVHGPLSWTGSINPLPWTGPWTLFFKDLTRCFSQIFSCAYVLCLHMCSRKTVKLTRSRTDSRYEQAEV